MPWYLDIVALGAMLVTGRGYMKGYHWKLMRSKAITKDGFKIRFNELMLLESKRNLGKEEEKFLNLTKRQKEDYRFDTGMGSRLFLYYGVSSLAAFWLGDVIIPLAMTGGYALAVLGMAHYNMHSNYKVGLRHIGQLDIAVPIEWRKHGLYAWNPYDMRGALNQLDSLKKELKHVEQVEKDAHQELAQYSGGIATLTDKNELEGYRNAVDSVKRHIEALTTCIQEELLLDKVPPYLQDHPEILEMKAEVILEKTAIPMAVEEKAEPHHIEVMKEIASNPDLPAEVAERAEKLVKKHDEQEAERKRQSAIDEALLSIETVEKFYEKNEEKVMK